MLCDCNIYQINHNENTYLYRNVILQDSKTYTKSNDFPCTSSTHKEQILLYKAKLHDLFYYTQVLEKLVAIILTILAETFGFCHKNKTIP
jgi:hypothetical protein